MSCVADESACIIPLSCNDSPILRLVGNRYRASIGYSITSMFAETLGKVVGSGFFLRLSSDWGDGRTSRKSTRAFRSVPTVAFALSVSRSLVYSYDGERV